MGLSDDVVVKSFEYLTDIPMSEIHEIEKILKKGANPVMYKKRLAFEIVKQLNNEEQAKKAQEYFERTIQQKRTADRYPDSKAKKRSANHY
jgi:tyrosyl-tRNA synthetase